MHLMCTHIKMTNIGGDGIHLKPTGKAELCRGILRASMDFSQTGKQQRETYKQCVRRKPHKVVLAYMYSRDIQQ